jgi:NAD(P)-dependent dehydrogenase (short-subunit alcohol dehydrogenase family)
MPPRKFQDYAVQKYTDEEMRRCVAILEDIVADSVILAQIPNDVRIALLKAAGLLSRPDRDAIRIRKKERSRVVRAKIDIQERNARASTGIRSARESSVFTAPKQILDARALEGKQLELINPDSCYICKQHFTKLHFFYDAMCPDCAELNYAKRFQTADLTGQVALITGSRLKIGYQATLMMLRAGARVIATTRFPVDSAFRFSAEKDFGVWKDRLHIYGLDLRHTPSVELFCNYVETHYDRLDLLINNAAQTVRRPPGFYAHLMKNEMLPYDSMPSAVQMLLRPFEECKKRLTLEDQSHHATKQDLALAWNGKMTGMGIAASAQLSQVPYVHDMNVSADEVFPKGKLDADLQQVDLRETNSWRLRLGEINTSEMIELQLVNAIAPFVLCNKLSGMMKRDNTGKKHIVNVSAMEGKFHRWTKTDRHPHTNMAKAALNMLTHTSASDLANYGIFMNAVDTGWVTDEDPITLSLRKQDVHDFQPPLDIVDGAARVCDPFFHGILTGKHWCGKFLKDYFPCDW